MTLRVLPSLGSLEGLDRDRVRASCRRGEKPVPMMLTQPVPAGCLETPAGPGPAGGGGIGEEALEERSPSELSPNHPPRA